MAKKQFKGLARDFINAMKTQFIGKGADPNDIFVQDLFNYEPPNKGIVNRLMKNGIGNIFFDKEKSSKSILLDHPALSKL